jgi:SAM-dependent methyltransferase
MAAIEASGPNAAQITYWNEVSGAKWVALQPTIDEQIRPLGGLAMERAALRPGERVLDVGCGCGATSVDLARRVAPGGSVRGIDISAPMLDRARQLAASEGVTVAFELADAQTHAFMPGSIDVLFSRFGVMFFADPGAAFANLRTALPPGGRLTFVCWQALPDNPWMAVPLVAALQHVPPPPLPAPGAPGPFSLADPARVREILAQGGFGNVQLEDVRQTVTVGAGAGVDETVEFMLQMGPAAAALRESPDPGLQPRVAAAVREAIAPYLTPQGVRMDSASWVVTATA